MTTASPEFLTVPIGNVKESPHNPRKHYDQKAIDELAASIKEKGILNPLLVRPLNGAGTFEIIGGSRRIRAAKNAGLAQIPILVRRDLTESDAFELMITDNLQRQDVHPLDEALGYEYLIKQYSDELRKTDPKAKLDMDATMKRIAVKIGKSTSYIYQRLKLNGLIDPVQKALFEDQLTPGHAILIARLQPPDQKRALDTCTRIISLPKGDGPSADGEGSISVRALAQWISEYVHVDVTSIAFSKTDPGLNPEAGPCFTCKKLVSNDPELHADIKNKNTCTDHNCFKKKVNAHFIQLKKKYGNRLYPITAGDSYYHHQHDDPHEPAEFTPRTFDQGLKVASRWKEHSMKPGETEKTKRIKWGVFVDGKRKGECIPISIVEPKTKRSPSSGPSGRTSKPPTEAQVQKEKEKKAKEALEAEIAEEISAKLFEQILTKARDPLPDFILQMAANDIGDRSVGTDKDPKELTKLQIKAHTKLTRDEACKLIVAGYISDSIEYMGLNAEVTVKLAKHYKIDTKAIEKKVRAELTPPKVAFTRSGDGTTTDFTKGGKAIKKRK